MTKYTIEFEDNRPAREIRVLADGEDITETKIIRNVFLFADPEGFPMFATNIPPGLVKILKEGLDLEKLFKEIYTDQYKKINKLEARIKELEEK